MCHCHCHCHCHIVCFARCVALLPEPILNEIARALELSVQISSFCFSPVCPSRKFPVVIVLASASAELNASVACVTLQCFNGYSPAKSLSTITFTMIRHRKHHRTPGLYVWSSFQNSCASFALPNVVPEASRMTSFVANESCTGHRPVMERQS